MTDLWLAVIAMVSTVLGLVAGGWVGLALADRKFRYGRWRKP